MTSSDQQICLITRDLDDESQVSQITQEMQRNCQAERMLIVSVFGNFEQIKNLITTWRSQSQNEIVIICYCLNSSKALEGAKRYLAMYEMKLGENGFVNLVIDHAKE